MLKIASFHNQTEHIILQIKHCVAHNHSSSQKFSKGTIYEHPERHMINHIH